MQDALVLVEVPQRPQDLAGRRGHVIILCNYYFGFLSLYRKRQTPVLAQAPRRPQDLAGRRGYSFGPNVSFSQRRFVGDR